MRKLSELNKTDVIYVKNTVWTPECMTVEEFLDSIGYNEFKSPDSLRGDVQIFTTDVSYEEMTTPKSIVDTIRNKIVSTTREEAEAFNKVLAENIDLQVLSDAVNKAIMAVPFYQKTKEEIQIDL